MLARIDSRELAEWEAYERAYGPLDDRWRDDMLAKVHEIMQGGESVVRNPRPYEIYQAMLDYQDKKASEGTEEERKQAVIDKMNEEFDDR